MTDRLVTHRVDDRWCVFRIADDDRSRFVASFPTLEAAAAWIFEHGDPHEVET